MNATRMAILLTGWTGGMSPPLGARKLCSPLAPLLGRPMLQRSLENLARLGCKQVHVFLGDDPARVRELLGGGERWGLQLHYHYLQAEEDLSTNLRRLRLDEARQYWLACDDRVPAMPASGGNQAACWESAGERHWAGLGCFSGGWLNRLPGCISRPDFERRLAASPAVQWVEVERPLSCESDSDFLRSTRTCLGSAQADSGGIHIGRGAVIHPSACLNGPLWIGKLVHVGVGVQLGPNAVLEDGAVIDERATIQDSAVLSDTYVGKELSLQHCVAAPGRLASVNQDVVLDEICPMLLTSVHDSQRPPWLARLLLWLLKAALLPLWWRARDVLRSARQPVPVERMRLLRPGGGHGQTQTLYLADTLEALHAGEAGALARHFVHTFYPGLSAVLRGQLVLCGPQLRDAEQVAGLPAYWRGLYEEHPCGLLHPSIAGPGTEDPYSLDLLTVADNSLHLRLRLLGRYLKQLVQELVKPSSGTHSPPASDKDHATQNPTPDHQGGRADRHRVRTSGRQQRAGIQETDTAPAGRQ